MSKAQSYLSHTYGYRRDLGHAKLDVLEKDARQAKEQLAELARTATDYSSMLQKREADITRLSSELTTAHRERDLTRKQSAELQGQLETFAAELDAQKNDRARDAQSRAKLQGEIDELRALMDAKTSEDSKRAEVERSKEQELNDLRQQANRLQEQLAEARRLSSEEQSKLKVELENLQTECNALQKSHDDLLKKGKTLEAQRKETDVSLLVAEKAKRAAESELQSIRTRQIDVDGQLADAVKAKEVRAIVIYAPVDGRHGLCRLSNANSQLLRLSIRILRMQFCRLNARRPLGYDKWMPYESN